MPRLLAKYIAKIILSSIIILNNPTNTLKAQENNNIDFWLPLTVAIACDTLHIRNFLKATNSKNRLVTETVLESIISKNSGTSKCLTAAITAQDKLRNYLFRRDLEICPTLDGTGVIVDLRKEDFKGKWFCDTKNFNDWLKFNLWRKNKNELTIINIEDKGPIFDPGPTFTINEYRKLLTPSNSHTYQNCIDQNANKSAADLRQCIFDEKDRHDRILNSAYGCLNDNMTETGFAEIKINQRNWIKKRDNKCAYADQQGTIAHDLRAGCLLDETSKQAAKLLLSTKPFQCNIPNINSVALDLNIWKQNPSGASVSNEWEYRIVIVCGNDPHGKLSGPANGELRRLAAIEGNGIPSLGFYGKSNERITSLNSKAEWAGDTIRFEITSEVIKFLRSASSFRYDHDPFGVEFKLNGSSSALETCSISKQKPKVASKNSNQAALSYPTYQKSNSAYYIDLKGDLPLKFRCDLPAPEAYFKATGLLASLFGGNLNIGEQWSFESIRRNGKTSSKELVVAEQLSDGIGFRLSSNFLYESKKASNLIISGNGKEHKISIAAQSNTIGNCANASYRELEKFIIGKWIFINNSKYEIFIANNTVNTFIGAMSFQGSAPIQPRAFILSNNGKQGKLTPWMLPPSGNLHLNYNETICGVKIVNDKLEFTNVFDCRLKGTWQRKKH